MDVPQDIFIAAIISHRTAWEFPRSIKLWNIMVDGGILPGVAYMLMAVFIFDGEDSVTVGNPGNNHFPVDDHIGTDSVINFLKNRPRYKLESFQDYGGYDTVSKWGERYEFKSPEQLYYFFKQIFDERFPHIKGGFGGRISGKATCKELVSIVLEYQGTLLKEFV